MINRKVALGLVILILITGFWFGISQFVNGKFPEKDISAIIRFTPEEKTRVEAYIRENIGTLSSEETVLGGKFFVTRVVFIDTTTAFVNYEDGHNAFQARASFFIDANKTIKVLDFITVQKN